MAFSNVIFIFYFVAGKRPPSLARTHRTMAIYRLPNTSQSLLSPALEAIAVPLFRLLLVSVDPSSMVRLTLIS